MNQNPSRENVLVYKKERNMRVATQKIFEKAFEKRHEKRNKQ